jgi:hypothetical protein
MRTRSNASDRRQLILARLFVWVLFFPDYCTMSSFDGTHLHLNSDGTLFPCWNSNLYHGPFGITCSSGFLMFSYENPASTMSGYWTPSAVVPTDTAMTWPSQSSTHHAGPLLPPVEWEDDQKSRLTELSTTVIQERYRSSSEYVKRSMRAGMVDENTVRTISFSLPLNFTYISGLATKLRLRMDLAAQYCREDIPDSKYACCSRSEVVVRIEYRREADEVFAEFV